MISNQPRAMRLTNLKLLAQLQPLFHPFSNHLWSLKSVWLSAAQFVFTNCIILCSQWHFFPALLKHQISRLVERNQSNSRKMRDNFCNFYKPAQYTGSIKYLNRMKIPCLPCWILLFQNRCSKVVIKLRVVQFWYKIILVISIKLALRVYEITRMSSDQTALHSVPLSIKIAVH